MAVRDGCVGSDMDGLFAAVKCHGQIIRQSDAQRIDENVDMHKQ